MELSFKSLIQGATVYIDDVPVGQTDSYGRIRIYNVTPGTHVIRAEKPGYESASIVINVPDQLSVILDLRRY